MSDLLKFAYALDGPDAGHVLDEPAAIAALKADRCAWAHLPANDPRSRDWIATHLSYLDRHAIAALLADETRPRATVIGEGVLLILRGVNTNDGEDPEDMVSVRVWADPHRVITLARKRVRAIEELAEDIAAGRVPDGAGGFLAALADRLGVRIEAFGRELDAEADALEEAVIDMPAAEMRHKIVDLRLAAITFRRYVTPQREALEALMRADTPMIGKSTLRRLQEAHDRLTRLIEDLDAMRDRLAVLREELAGQLSDKLNRNMYLLSILSAVFLPLGFLTGLFGINVGGLPGADNSSAFWLFTAAMIAIAAGLLGFLRWKRWF